MSVTAIEHDQLSDLLKVTENQLWEAGYMTKAVTVNEASDQEYTIGTLLGKVDADGKYKIWDTSLTDGAEKLAAIVIENVSVPASTDTKVLAIVRGPAIVGGKALKLNGESLEDAVAGLEAMNPPIEVADQL